jgi:hypothetical protein
MLVTVALLKRSIEKARATLAPDATNLRIEKKGMDQCCNCMTNRQQIYAFGATFIVR